MEPFQHAGAVAKSERTGDALARHGTDLFDYG